ncbi:nitric oxide synthase oxygenase [Micromonospora sp. NBC_01655]|uniref:nitric oxide synthase oxygenase n=1 Tax=Micromonospora sp. NBC_01655 TaxID=2975983 RepID=UPI00224F431C|nr:nitric oxide synthase oxygenase [Micromonospora sp. NBC_01655]MCX4472316.1 nitric oxide synthase oxygenase [Micromonospora sp. NBC_01655]
MSTPPPVGDTLAEAVEFLHLFHEERRLPGVDARIAQVREEVALTGAYRHTREELAYGAKVAWRQSARCVGRVRWAGLRVRDRRDVTTVAGIARELAQHLAVADNGGRIQSVMTVFAPDRPGVGPRARIWNDQLIRYCGHRCGAGSVLGDPGQVAMTDAALRLGWRPPPVPGRFDLLPWVIETAYADPTLVQVPRDLVREVALVHPAYPWFEELRLRWHALPVISNMRLRVGGVDYSCAPFNGHYLGDEIGTRNLGDRDRYDQLLPVARGLGLDTSREDTLWREHAVLVLNQAVLHSFRLAGVRVSDPHTESELFMKFCAQEERAGRPVHGDWSWLNGSVGWAALHAVHHRYYDPRVPNPNLWPAERAYGPAGVVEQTLRERHDAARRRED